MSRIPSHSFTTLGVYYSTLPASSYIFSDIFSTYILMGNVPTNFFYLVMFKTNPL